MNSPSLLDEVRIAAVRSREARERLEVAIAAATREHSLREVSDAAGLTRERIRQIASPRNEEAK